MIADVNIPLPVDKSGNVCTKAQKDIAVMYEAIEQFRNEILSKLDALIKQRIDY
jgi:hypothetical protein